jgi:hydroxyethylthiazole kinase-like uncharacterized protein yjeF
MRRLDFHARQALHGVDATRRIEHAFQATLLPHTLMQRAGQAVARLALALAPHARNIWIACGPGNNGGDGLEAAMHLQQWGKSPVVTWLGHPDTTPPDALASYQRAVHAGVTFAETPPHAYDLCIDALLGIGAQTRAPEGRMAEWITRMNAGSAPVLAVDVPTGLQSDTGHAAPSCVHANHTLSLLTLKPGLFTAHGRDTTGSVWLDTLGCNDNPSQNLRAPYPTAWLAGAPEAAIRLHATHKGSYGDVAVVGGSAGMTGAALLASCAALHAGAGRIFVSLLDDASLSFDACQPELMFRAINTLDLTVMTVVCGCGGGEAIHAQLPKLLLNAARIVIDADAINSIASDTQLQTLARNRNQRLSPTILTPHPLEAARLLGCSVPQVQQNRLACAQQLAQRFDCIVVLKGSGTVIAAPGSTPSINPTGNARLASAGTGDVLAGMIGARLAAGQPAFQAACDAVYQHGHQADYWPEESPLTAGTLAKAL